MNERQKTGFANMDLEKRRAIASRGGRAAHQKGVAHEFTRAEAQAAGRKGGAAISQDREHMARIGRAGGKSSGNRRAMLPRTKIKPVPMGEEKEG